MELRPQLTAQPSNKRRIQEIRVRIEEIEKILESGGSADMLIASFNSLTGRDYDEEYFRDYWTSMSINDFAREAARFVPSRVPDASREELIEVVRRIQALGKDYECYMEIFDANTFPGASLAVFQPPDHLASAMVVSQYDPTAEEIVDAALGRGPILVPVRDSEQRMNLDPGA